MIPTLCNPVATQPYVFLPLKGNTNDYSINNYSVTNNSITTANGEFGEPNGSYESNSNTDNLTLPNSALTDLINIVNAGGSFTFLTRYAFDTNNRLQQFFGNFGSSGSNRQLGYLYNGSGYNDYYGGPEFFDGTSPVNTKYTFVPTNNTFYQYGVVCNKNVEKQYHNGLKVTEDTTNYTGKNFKTATVFTFQIFNTNYNYGFDGRQHDVRFYDVALFDGEFAVLNQQKGRIKC